MSWLDTTTSSAIELHMDKTKPVYSQSLQDLLQWESTWGRLTNTTQYMNNKEGLQMSEEIIIELDKVLLWIQVREPFGSVNGVRRWPGKKIAQVFTRWVQVWWLRLWTNHTVSNNLTAHNIAFLLKAFCSRTWRPWVLKSHSCRLPVSRSVLSSPFWSCSHPPFVGSFPGRSSRFSDWGGKWNCLRVWDFSAR